MFLFDAPHAPIRKRSLRARSDNGPPPFPCTAPSVGHATVAQRVRQVKGCDVCAERNATARKDFTSEALKVRQRSCLEERAQRPWALLRICGQLCESSGSSIPNADRKAHESAEALRVTASPRPQVLRVVEADQLTAVKLRDALLGKKVTNVAPVRESARGGREQQHKLGKPSSLCFGGLLNCFSTVLRGILRKNF